MKKHVDTFIIVGIMLTGFYWINGKFDSVDVRLTAVETRLTKIETVLVLQKIMPCEMAVKNIKEIK